MAAVNFNTEIAMTDGSVTEVEFNLKIRATVEGGVSITKDVKITVTVCGSETLSVVDSSVLS
jgi:hypothetical protein